MQSTKQQTVTAFALRYLAANVGDAEFYLGELGLTEQDVIDISNAVNEDIEPEQKQLLVDRVIAQLKADIAHGDATVLDELLHYIPSNLLQGSLPE